MRDIWRGVSSHALGVQQPGLHRGFNRSTANLVLARSVGGLLARSSNPYFFACFCLFCHLLRAQVYGLHLSSKTWSFWVGASNSVDCLPVYCVFCCASQAWCQASFYLGSNLFALEHKKGKQSPHGWWCLCRACISRQCVTLRCQLPL